VNTTEVFLRTPTTRDLKVEVSTFNFLCFVLSSFPTIHLNQAITNKKFIFSRSHLFVLNFLVLFLIHVFAVRCCEASDVELATIPPGLVVS